MKKTKGGHTDGRPANRNHWGHKNRCRRENNVATRNHSNEAKCLWFNDG